MSDTASVQHIKLTKDEFSLLIEASLPGNKRYVSLKFVMILGLVSAVGATGWSLYSGNWEPGVFAGLSTCFSGMAYDHDRSRRISINLIRKLQGNPHEGRRAIDTAIPHELSENPA